MYVYIYTIMIRKKRTRQRVLSSSCFGTLFSQQQSSVHTKPILRFHSHALACMVLANRCCGPLLLREAGGIP